MKIFADLQFGSTTKILTLLFWGGIRLKDDLLKVFFILWGLILFFELVWFSTLSYGAHLTSAAIFAITVIVVTSVFGSVGLFFFRR